MTGCVLTRSSPSLAPVVVESAIQAVDTSARRDDLDNCSGDGHEAVCRVHRRGVKPTKAADRLACAVWLDPTTHRMCGIRCVDRRCLYPDDLGALLFQLCCVLLVCLLLAVLETLAPVVL